MMMVATTMMTSSTTTPTMAPPTTGPIFATEAGVTWVGGATTSVWHVCSGVCA